jgi:hypothetical protein
MCFICPIRRQPVEVTDFLEQVPDFPRIKGVGSQCGVIARRPRRDERRDEHPMAFDIPEEIVTVDGEIHRIMPT